jgi:hypothetical protein
MSRPVYQSTHNETQLSGLNRQLVRYVQAQADALQSWTQAYETSVRHVDLLANLLPRYRQLDAMASATETSNVDDTSDVFVPVGPLCAVVAGVTPTLHHDVEKNGILAHIPGLNSRLRTRALEEIALLLSSLSQLVAQMDSYAQECVSLHVQAESAYRDTSIAHTEATMLLWETTARASDLTSLDDDLLDEDEVTRREENSRRKLLSLTISQALQVLQLASGEVGVFTARLQSLVTAACSYVSNLQPGHHTFNLTLHTSTSTSTSSHPAPHLALASAPPPPAPPSLRLGSWTLDTLVDAWRAGELGRVRGMIRVAELSKVGVR